MDGPGLGLISAERSNKRIPSQITERPTKVAEIWKVRRERLMKEVGVCDFQVGGNVCNVKGEEREEVNKGVSVAVEKESLVGV